MGSKGRMPPHPLRHPIPGAGVVHPDPFGPGGRPPLGPFPPFDGLPPPEVLEQKLVAQHVEMQRLVTENRRLAATHVTLRQELAAAQHDLQVLHAHIGGIKAEREQQTRGLADKVAKMEVELKAAEPARLELQQTCVEAEKLVAARQELMSKVHQLNQDLHRAHTDAQQIPVLMSELENLRQEYQRCRVSYDYEKKLFNDHLESLQVMEKNYITMSREVEKLRTELTNTANVDIRSVAGGHYGGATGNNENEASGRPAGQTVYEKVYGVPQSQGYAALPVNSNSVAVSTNAGAANSAGATTVTPTYLGAQSGPAPPNPGYEASRGPTYEAPKGPGYDVSRAPGYDPQRGHIYDTQRGPGYVFQRGPGYDAQRLPGYDVQRGLSYDVQRGPGYDMQRGPNYDASGAPSYDVASRGAAVGPGQAIPANNMPYGSATPPARAANAYETAGRGGNAVRR